MVGGGSGRGTGGSDVGGVVAGHFGSRRGQYGAKGGGEGFVVGLGYVDLMAEAYVDVVGGGDVGTVAGFFAGGFGSVCGVGCVAETEEFGVVGLHLRLVGDLIRGEDFFRAGGGRGGLGRGLSVGERRRRRRQRSIVRMGDPSR